ncbi:MAG: PspA-associated protein PspAB, partial [Chloroflexota bacterium]
MSFLDRLLGTSKPVASKTEALFAMTTAVITLQ